MTGAEMLRHIAQQCRDRAERSVELGARLSFDPAYIIREENERAALYDATADDIAGLPEDVQADKARRFMFAMFARDERDERDYEPDDLHP